VLFPNADYQRADIENALERTACDYVIAPDGRVPAPSSHFDIVLSTQVAEHLERFETYFNECFRVLKPGGRLYLSTHGLFEEHGHPYDFQRWTAEGLRRDLSRRGFDVRTLEKLTTGPRAAAFLVERNIGSVFLPRSTLRGLMHWGARIGLLGARSIIHRHFDHHYDDFRVVSAETPGHNMYVAILAVAHRPD
jgi:SAM-dependent methyltransferase